MITSISLEKQSTSFQKWNAFHRRGSCWSLQKGPFFRTNYRPWSWEAKKMFSPNSPTLPSDICVELKHRFIPNKLLAFHHKKKKRVENVLEDRHIKNPAKTCCASPNLAAWFFVYIGVYSSAFIKKELLSKSQTAHKSLKVIIPGKN